MIFQPPGIAGSEFLTMGYGSGDAAEVIPFFIADSWREATKKIGFGDAMKMTIDLNEEQYIALHDGRKAIGLDYIPNNEFVIDRVGRSDERHFADLGIDEGADPAYVVRVLELPPAKEAGKIIQGEDDPNAAAAELVKLLRDEAKAI